MTSIKPNAQPTRHNSSSRFSLRQAVAAPLLLAAVFSATPVTSALAQDVEQIRAKVAARLGIKAEALTPKTLPETYQGNPGSENRQSSDVIVYDRNNPHVRVESTSGVSDMVGTTSVEDFQGTQSNLSHTHESADGFRNYFNTWYTPNFGRRDSAVSVWQFHDFASYNYDLWTSGGTDLGADGVRVMFHSGHGGMSSPNNFFAPMGANWSNNGWNARSSNMALGGNYYSYGDERLRYLFWDTCNSVMVSGGNNPYSTWGVRSKGIRMVFGYETVSIDNPNYGKYFWEEWNKGKSLSTAFLDASWRINTRQSPAVVAFGANQTEATDRLYNERYLSAGAAANNWGQWRWYTARSAASLTTATTNSAEANGQTPTQQPLAIPRQARVQQVAERSNTNDEIIELSRSLGIGLDDSNLIQERASGIRAVNANNATLVVEKNGNFELMIQPTDSPTASEAELSDEALIQRANEIAGQLSILNGQKYRVGLMRETKESGGFEGFTDNTRTVEKTVIIDQTIDGVPFIDTEAGHLEVTFDARNGQTTRVRSSLRRITAAIESVESGEEVSLEQVRRSAIQRFAAPARRGSRNAAPAMEIVPESEAIGYQMIDGKAVPVYRALVKDPNFELSRPQMAIIPLVKGN
jgi:hypothetical protein